MKRIIMVQNCAFSALACCETTDLFSSRDDSTYSCPMRRDNFRPRSASSDLNEANSDTTNTHTATLSDAPLRTQTQPLVTTEEDVQNENIAHAMKLLLAARERVLTLSEQRVSPLSYSYTNAHCRTAPRPSHPAADFSPNDNHLRPRTHNLAQPNPSTPSLRRPPHLLRSRFQPPITVPRCPSSSSTDPPYIRPNGPPTP